LGFGVDDASAYTDEGKEERIAKAKEIITRDMKQQVAILDETDDNQIT